MLSQRESLINEWVQLYTGDLLNWCNFKINDLAQAEDIVQDTFLAAFENVESFKGQSSPRTWLYKILNNKIVDYYRKKSKLEFVRPSLEVDQANDVTDSMFTANGGWNKEMFNKQWGDGGNVLDDKEFRNVLLMCLEDLPVKWKNALLSKYILERNSNDICQELEISSSNYWQILHRSKLLLKVCIENNWFKK